MSSRPSARTRQQQQQPAWPGEPQESFLHKAIMTPIIFVSFLFSLAWVEFRYSVLRSHSHGDRASSSSSSSSSSSHSKTDCHHSWMPAWLHRLVYRRQGYQYVVVRKTAGADTSTQDTYYHSMQRKLLKMETDEAFRIRTTVLAVLAGGAAVALWGGVAGVRWLLSLA